MKILFFILLNTFCVDLLCRSQLQTGLLQTGLLQTSLLNLTFNEGRIANARIDTNANDLLKIAQSSIQYLHSPKAKTDKDINSVLFKNKNLYLRNTSKTLEKLSSMIKNNPNLTLRDLNRQFRYIKWNGNTKDNPNKIRLTKYLVFKVNGSYVKTNKYKYALYSSPNDEIGLSQSQIKQRKKSLTRFKYTKQDALKGAIDNKAKALAWITQDGLEEALMQGTILVQFPDYNKKIFNVHKSNGIDYKKYLTKYKQKRYWYFKETNAFNGYGKNPGTRTIIKPNVTFAGDVKHLGFGTLIAIKYKNILTQRDEIKLGIIADTGGAFRNNLKQLDYFTGTFNDKASFKKETMFIPDYVEAFILTNL